MLMHSNSSIQKVSKDLMGSTKFVRQMPNGRDPFKVGRPRTCSIFKPTVP